MPRCRLRTHAPRASVVSLCHRGLSPNRARASPAETGSEDKEGGLEAAWAGR